MTVLLIEHSCPQVAQRVCPERVVVHHFKQRINHICRNITLKVFHRSFQGGLRNVTQRGIRELSGDGGVTVISEISTTVCANKNRLVEDSKYTGS